MNKEQVKRYKIFTKVPWDKLSAAYYILLIFTSCLYSALFDSVRIKTANEDGGLLIVSVCYCLAIFFIIMLSKYIFAVLCPILFYLGSMSRLYSSELFLDTTKETAPLFTSDKAVSFFISDPSNKIFIILMFCLGIIIAIARFFVCDKSVIRRGQAFALFFIFAAGASRYGAENENNFTPMPSVYISSIQDYLRTKLAYSFFKQEKKAVNAATDENDITVIFITIDKLSDNLFKNKDNINIFNNSNIRIFTEIEPCSSNYGISYLCISEKENKDDNEQSFSGITITSLFASAGFDTYRINISNNLIGNSAIIYNSSKEAKTYINIETSGSPSPFSGINTIYDIIKNNGNKFLNINIEGNMPKIKSRYVDLFNKQRNGISEEENEYLNYIGSLNAFIYKIAEQLVDKRAVLVFSGLTGENLTNGIGKGNGNTVFGIWVSETFEKERIKTNYESIDRTWIFNTVAGCGGLKSEEIDNTKNLCMTYDK